MSIAFRFEIDGALTGEENMRRDAALVDTVRDSATGVVRLYAWKPYAVSLGFNQRAEVIDVDACRALGIDVVRRPTGGRAVLHAEELTYAVATPLDGRTAQQWYADIHLAIGDGVAQLGLSDAAFVKSQPKFAEVYRQSSGAMCFTASARYELEWNGRKFVGSAQRVIGGVLLQHGSILLGPYHARMGELLAIGPEERATMSHILRDRAISISEILGRRVLYDDLVGPLHNSMKQLLA